jgi:hypothetical protein
MPTRILMTRSGESRWLLEWSEWLMEVIVLRVSGLETEPWRVFNVSDC